MVERQLGNLDEAEALSREAVRITVESGDKMALPWVLNGLAAVTEAKADHERAAVLVGAAEGLLGGASRRMAAGRTCAVGDAGGLAQGRQRRTISTWSEAAAVLFFLSSCSASYCCPSECLVGELHPTLAKGVD